MGWSFRCRPCSKQEYIREVLAGFHPHKVIDHHSTARGNLWTVIELTEPGLDADNEPVGMRFIHLDLLQSEKGCWGNKGIPEMAGPSECDCPLAFLALAPPVPGSHVADFRARVRAWHAAIATAPKLTPGLVFQLYGHTYRAVAKIGRSWSAEKLATGKIYRVGPKHFAKVEAVLPASKEVPADAIIPPDSKAAAEARIDPTPAKPGRDLLAEAFA